MYAILYILGKLSILFFFFGQYYKPKKAHMYTQLFYNDNFKRLKNKMVFYQVRKVYRRKNQLYVYMYIQNIFFNILSLVKDLLIREAG